MLPSGKLSLINYWLMFLDYLVENLLHLYKNAKCDANMIFQIQVAILKADGTKIGKRPYPEYYLDHLLL